MKQIEIILIILFILVSAGFGIFYYLNYMNQPEEYIWVGPGEDPFKEKSSEKKGEGHYHRG